MKTVPRLSSASPGRILAMLGVRVRKMNICALKPPCFWLSVRARPASVLLFQAAKLDDKSQTTPLAEVPVTSPL